MMKPLITIGTIITIIEGVRNPYLLNDGNIGWINNTYIIKKLKIIKLLMLAIK